MALWVVSYTLENPRVSPSLSPSLPLSVTLTSERRVEGIGGESAEELLPRGRRTDGTKKKNSAGTHNSQLKKRKKKKRGNTQVTTKKL